MENFSRPLPVYIKGSIFLMGLLSFFYAIYLAQEILLPLVFSTLVAILLDQVVNFFVKKRFNRTIAIFITLVAALILMTSLIVFIWTQFSNFSETLPLFKEKFNLVFKQFSGWITGTFNISIENFNDLIIKKIEGMNDGVLIGNTVNTATHFFVTIILIPVYIFFILFYKFRILEFIKELFLVKLNLVVEILSQIKVLIQQYLIGLLIQLALVSCLTSIGLFILGIQNPLLFGVVSGFLNMIPYLGVITANIIIVTITFVTKSASSALYVFILYGLVQFIDNNFIVTKIVGRKVKMNALSTIVTVIVGGQLCGVAGMFLSIPVMAAFKAVCDNVQSLKPLGYLLDDGEFDKEKINKSTEAEKLSDNDK